MAEPELQVAIVGGGISGLATAFRLKQLAPELTDGNPRGMAFRVLEKESIAGGKVRSSLQGGFTFDWGPNGLARTPATLELMDALGLSSELREASAGVKKRFVYADGKLRPMPSSPATFLKSSLLSPAGKARVLLELLNTRRGDSEESVYDFIARRFGREAAEAFAAPLVTGIAAGDPKKLSLDALFPNLRGLEREHGSLLRGLLASRKRVKSNGGGLATFQGGMGHLSGRLGQALEAELVTETEVVSVVPGATGYTLKLASGEALEAEQVVLATPAYVSAELLEPFAPETARLLASIPYADVGVFGLGYDRSDILIPLDGFGFLVPRGQGVRSLGVLWSSIFPDQAPAGKVLLRVIVGGSLDPGFLELDDEAALAAVRRDLRATMSIRGAPEQVTYMRWPGSIPQYELGHQRKLQRLREVLAAHPGLHLSGNAYDGVGVNACLRNAKRLAQQLTRHHEAASRSPARPA